MTAILIFIGACLVTAVVGSLLLHARRHEDVADEDLGASRFRHAKRRPWRERLRAKTPVLPFARVAATTGPPFEVTRASTATATSAESTAMANPIAEPPASPDATDDEADAEDPDRSRHLTKSNMTRVAIAAALVLGGLIVGLRVGGNGSDSSLPVRSGRQVRVEDRFSRATDPAELGTPTTGPAWKPVSGKWIVHNGLAETTPGTKQKSIAVLDTGVTDAEIAVTLGPTPAGAGVVFRWRDDANYWSLRAAPTFGTWNLYRMNKGVETLIGNTGVAPSTPGTVVLIRMAGDSIEIMINGRSVCPPPPDRAGKSGTCGRPSDPGHEQATFAGLMVSPTVATAHFDDFVVTTPLAAAGSR